ncbi:potassium-transporting ATPase subunit KdpC [Fodinibacter luteus]|uniref:Potassium-transporting ATPase KdpC subunit n=1 Tax=Fodinibacter luteus TaxID=552064 RepID=A0ABP8KRP2_9MICO
MITVAIARQLAASVKALLVLTLVAGLLYPAAILAIGLVVPGQANGSLIEVDGTVVGSSLLGQAAGGPQWFQARPSASDHAGDTSGGSNLGPSSEELASQVSERGAALREANPDAPASIPADALTASASGLDPHISPEYAAYQVPRVAAARGMSAAQVQRLVAAHTEHAVLGFLGQDRVNVTELNVSLATADASTGSQ